MTSPAEEAFQTASARLLGAGCTLATVVSHAPQTDPLVARTLQIHEEAKTAYDTAFDALMATAAETHDPAPADLADKSIAAIRAALEGRQS